MAITTNTKYNILGKPTQIDYPDGSQERFTYYTDGTLAASIARNGVTTHYLYDDLKRLIQKKVLDQDENELAAETQEWSAFHLLRKIDSEGLVTEFEYDFAGRKTAEKTGNRLRTFSYDLLGRLHKTTEWIDDDAHVKVFIYDFLDRLIEERVEDSLKNLYQITQYTYDERGNCTQVIIDDSITTTEYDSLSRVTQITDAEGNATFIFYDDYHINKQGETVFKKTQIDPLGREETTIHDILGRIAKVIKKDPFGNFLCSRTHTYDAAGNRTSIRYQITGGETRFVTHAWEYDSCNRIISTIEALGAPEQKISYTHYNSCGEKETVTKPDGITITHTYTPLGFLETLTSSDKTIHYEWSYNSIGLPTEVVDKIHDSKTLFSYNDHHELTQETLGNGLTLSYSYDQRGRPTQKTLPDGTTAYYTYDAVHLRHIQYQNWTHSYLSYCLTGSLISSKLIGNAGLLDTQYDRLGRVRSQQHPHRSTSLVTYDAVSNLTSQTINGNLKTYTYDHLSQLTSEEGYTYTYDTQGNRLSKNNETYHINALNQLENHTYDLNGNLIQSNNATYTYDALDRLIQVHTNTKTYTYTYDAFNRRLQRISDDKTQSFFYAGQEEIGSTDTQGNWEKRILGIGPGAEIGATILIEVNSKTYAPLHDLHGNITALIDPHTGTAAQSHTYTAYGETTPSLSPWTTSSKRHDPETNWIYFGRRYYDPSLGRWTTADPKGFDAGPNLYTYVANNPLTNIDLFGLEWIRKGDNWVIKEHQNPSYSNNFIGKAINHTGRGLEYIGNQIMPPVASNIIGALGRGLQGKGMHWQPDYYHHSKIVRIPGKRVWGTRHAFVNGMINDFETAYGHAQRVSKRYGGVETYLVYNSTHGLISDCVEWFCEKHGIPTRPVRKATKLMKQLVKEVRSEAGSDGRVYWHGHSEGAEITFQGLIRQERGASKNLVVYTFGGARMIGKWGYAKSDNFVCKGDVVPAIADPEGYREGCLDGWVTQLDPLSNSGHHNFSGATYDNALKKIGDEFKANHVFRLGE